MSILKTLMKIMNNVSNHMPVCINKYDRLTLNSEGGDNWEDSFYCGTFLHYTKSGRNMFEKAHFISLIWILPSLEATWQNSTKLYNAQLESAIIS